MKGDAIAVGVLAIIVLIVLAVITAIKATGLVDNTTANKFITGLGYFATFIGIIVLVLIAKIIVGIFKKTS